MLISVASKYDYFCDYQMYRFILLTLIAFLTSCSNLLFVPTKPYPVTPKVADILYDDIYIEAADGVTVHGWKMHADGGWIEKGKLKRSHANQKVAGTIVFFHGNGDNVSTQLPNTFWLAKEGFDLYVFDYREYGQSQGEADLDDIISDMELMLGYVAEHLPDDEKMIVMGHSLGGAMAIYSVAHSDYQEKIEALITLEAFSDYHHVAQDALSSHWLTWLFQWPLSFTVSNDYSPVDSIGLISPIPVCIIHSTNDEMIGMFHADRLFAAAKEPKTFKLLDSNHSNVLVTKDNRQVLFDYLKTLKR
jgi:alpha-beta hydrolase superfamily lysophospholipase